MTAMKTSLTVNFPDEESKASFLQWVQSESTTDDFGIFIEDNYAGDIEGSGVSMTEIKGELEVRL